jgi:indolepyruvate ferredoxin oxidoreductase
MEDNGGRNAMAIDVVSVTAGGRALRDVSLADRWSGEADDAVISGVQALVRALLDMRREDERNGVRGGGFVSGYPGSPLGGLDKELERQGKALGAVGVEFQPGLNEELAATAVWGSQLAYQLAGAKVDGVLGMWFGKNPGLDRAADALRHANFSGVGPAGGAVAVVGDDPASKSSTLPSSAERTLAGMYMPVLSAASVQDVLDLTRHAWRLSRASGLWCALKIVADIADASSTVTFTGPGEPVARRVDYTPTSRLLGAPSVEVERSLVEERLPAALAYARENELNRVTVRGPRDEIGVIAAGSAYAELSRALQGLGLGDDQLRELGVRVLKLAMPWPVDTQLLRDFAAGLETVVVVEDKLGFLEPEVRSALYGVSGAPRVLGKLDADGAPLLSAYGALSSDEIAGSLGRLLGDRIGADSEAAQRISKFADRARPLPLPLARTPFFCSGCPHSSSTAAEPGTLVGAGIGCHVMLVQGGDRGGDIVGLTQMGGEGSQWIGMAPFVAEEHFTQNIGDGTFHHSGSLALRAAVASKRNITYKLLYNDAVAMTGGQHVPGVMSVPQLTRMLKAEGVAKVVVTTDEPSRYRRVRLAPGVKVHDRTKLPEIERELAAVPGVTVLIHDQMCAAEQRRLRRRGKLEDPPERAWINERVCEGCGDCGEKSGCLSVEPVETEFGRRTRIHQESCNKDMSCLRGDCPSFLTVVPGKKTHLAPEPPADLPEPAASANGAATIRMVGIGGTGVVTVAQVLAMAAHLQGEPAAVLDQTGLSQKGGPVVSDVRIGESVEADPAPRAAERSVDLLLGFDLLGAADPRYLRAADPQRTVAVLSDAVNPTGEMVVHPSVPFPDRDDLVGRVAATVATVPVVTDAQEVAERAFGDNLQSNMVLLGAAWQLGAVPIRWDALTRAIELNGAAIENNLKALRWGRAVVADPAAVEALLADPADEHAFVPAEADLAEARRRVPAPLVELVAQRMGDLRGWGGNAAAEDYLEAVERVAAREAEMAPGHDQITESVARQLHHLMAYKDEYEVARLHLLPEERARREREFGAGAKWWVNLHPPVLRAMGLNRKLRFGRWATPMFYGLRAGRRLRGTPLDVFGYAAVRRLERELPGEYLEGIETALSLLTEETHGYVLSLSEQADQIRGYEEIKLRNVAAWRASSAALLEQLGGSWPASARQVKIETGD